MGRKYSKKILIDGMRAAWKAGLDVRRVGLNNTEYAFINNNLFRYFSSRENLYKAAKITLEQVFDRAEDLLVKDFQTLYQANPEANLSIVSLKKNKGPIHNIYEKAKSLYREKNFWGTFLFMADVKQEKIDQYCLTQNKVKNELVKLCQSNPEITSEEIDKINRNLGAHLRDYYKSLEEAKLDIGIIYERTGRPYIKEEIYRIFIRAYLSGEHLGLHRVLNKSKNEKLKRLVNAVRRRPEDYYQLLKVVGIEKYLYSDYARSSILTEDVWKATVYAMHQNGGSVSSKFIRIMYPHLFDASLRLFPGMKWREKLAFADVNYRQVRDPVMKSHKRKYTLENLVSSVSHLLKLKKTLKPSALIADYQTRKIFIEVLKKFDNWADFLSYCGIDSKLYCQPTDAEVEQYLRKYIKVEVKKEFDSGKDANVLLRLLAKIK